MSTSSSNSSSSLPLFRLPPSAQEIAILNMEPVEIVELSLCSKKSYKLVKKFNENKFGLNINLNWEIGNEIELFRHETPHFIETFLFNRWILPNCDLEYIDSDDEEDLEEVQDLNPMSSRTINGITVPCSPNILCTFWKNELEGTLKMANYLLDLFNACIISMDVDLGKKEESYLFIKWIQEKRPLILDIKISTLENIDDIYTKTFLETINVTKILLCEINTSSEFKYNRKFELQYLLFLKTNVTLNNLLQMDCPEIRIGGVISNEDINSFLKEWRNGKQKKLKVLEFYIDLKWNKLTSGIPIFENLECKKAVKLSPKTINICIQSLDGMKATIRRKPSPRLPRVEVLIE